MCFSGAGAQTAELRSPGEAGAERQVVLAPSQWLFRKQGEKNGSRSRARGRSAGAGSRVAPGWGCWEAGRWQRKPKQEGEARSVIKERRRREGRRSAPQGSQSQQKARRCGYLCSERPRGSRALQQLHLALLRHRRYGRRLGRVALDHRRKVDSKAAGPLLHVPGPPLPFAPRSAALSEGNAAGACCKAWKRWRGHTAGWPGTGHPLFRALGPASGRDRDCGAGRLQGRSPPGGRALPEHQPGGGASESESDKPPPLRKVLRGRRGPRGLRLSCRLPPWHSRWKVFEATKASCGSLGR